MHRLYLRVISYFCPIYCFIVLIVSQNILASAANESEKPTKSDKSILTKDLRPALKKAKQNPLSILVPPPPPEQPSFLDWSNIGIMPESFNLLNEEELKAKLGRLRQEIDDAQKSLEENNIEVTDAKEKAERFISLYSEGVVSRKELEIAKKNVVQKERLSQEAKGKVEDLKVQENAILRRLTSLRKTSKNKEHTKKISNDKKQTQ